MEPRFTEVNVSGGDEKTIHQLLKEDMDRGVAEMHRIINERMFAVNVDEMFNRLQLQPPTWQQRLRWKWAQFADYWITIWKAIRGVDLYERGDFDEDY